MTFLRDNPLQLDFPFADPRGLVPVQFRERGDSVDECYLSQPIALAPAPATVEFAEPAPDTNAGPRGNGLDMEQLAGGSEVHAS